MALAGPTLVLADPVVAGAGLPGGRAFALLAAVIGVGAAVLGLRACARPESVVGPARPVLRGSARDAVRGPCGSGLVVPAVATAGTTAALSAWMPLPPAFLVPGPPASALTAADLRGNGSLPGRACDGVTPGMSSGGGAHGEHTAAEEAVPAAGVGRDDR
ncbi:hypothetical protein [Streptomyces bottropensis]|uniref:hypothetical protein n=1 Tax=Streptomyces bottropensis TaxID=42235 RepID=UPI0036758278